MKAILGWSAVFVTLVLLWSCSSLPSSVGNVLGSVASGSASSNAAASAAAPIGFPSGDVLATDNASKTDGTYWVVKVLTPASAATKNQAQVLRVEDGKEYWANFVTPSHKTVQAQLALGAEVFFLTDDSMNSSVNEQSYTQDPWQLGRVTSVDDLYKGQVQINGTDYYIKWTRMPN